MDDKYRWVRRLLLTICYTAWIISFVSILYVRIHVDALDSGVQLVRVMYDFSTPVKLAEQQLVVKDLLVEEEWERLQLDNEARVVNTYWKFQYSSSKVHIVDYSNGYVLYTLENDYIQPEQLWMLRYEKDEATGKLCNVREYKLTETMKGGYTR